MEPYLPFIFLFLLSTLAAMMVHGLSRAALGPRANGFPAAVIVLAFTVSPWWIGAIAGIVGHLASVWLWNYATGKENSSK